MKKLLIVTLFIISFCEVSYAQEVTSKETLAYAGGAYSYIGGSYIYMGRNLGIGVTLALNEATLSINHEDAVIMKDGEIKDWEHSYRYNEEFMYDRGFLTGRLYVRVGGSLDANSTWIYAGVGPGWSRYYYGYDRSEASETVYVLDNNLSKANTELEFGIAADLNGFHLSLGYGAVNASDASQVTWGIGFSW